MKKRLKTLKDCYEWTDEGFEQLTEEKLCDVAREWIKIWDNHRKKEFSKVKINKYISASDYDYSEPNFKTEVCLDDYVIAWIKHFFNLEDE